MNDYQDWEKTVLMTTNRPFKTRVDESVKELRDKWATKLKRAKIKAARDQTTDPQNSLAIRYAETFYGEIEGRLNDLVAVFEHEARLEEQIDVDLVLSEYTQRAGTEVQTVWGAWVETIDVDKAHQDDAQDNFHANTQAAVRWKYLDLRQRLRVLQDEEKKRELDRGVAKAQRDAADAQSEAARATKWAAFFALLSVLVAAAGIYAQTKAIAPPPLASSSKCP